MKLIIQKMILKKHFNILILNYYNLSKNNESLNKALEES